ncbi:MAG: hypothetical protein HN704_07055 [Bacteroidetes bacterium]|jgi:hypothetical protein|nr:hypothetical protein [Bacteroidota bacterium]MBT6686502.1 hypothetical protein [Bacteroidota bacterium]MBT7144239.1 hypothetical protein [Bacteroidota bacterium]MBT7491345.1 hypothetical protein [Bacteroidota bacterium]
MNLSTRIIYFIIIGLFAISCTKDDEPNPTMSAKVDGSSWSANEFETILLEVESQESVRLDIMATSSDKRRIKLALQCPDNDGILKETTYDMFDPINGSTFLYCTIDLNGGEFVDHVTESGYIIISEFDNVEKTVSGTFKFKTRIIGTNTYFEIKEGSFSEIEYVSIKY